MFAAVIGCGALAIGFGALLFPAASSFFFGMRARGDQTHYVRVTGARDIFIGFMFLFFYWREDRNALAAICFFTGFVAFCDFLITFKYGNRLISYSHFAATILVVAYGVWFLHY